MFIEKLSLKSFKGFDKFTVEFGSAPFTCLVGLNGGGKTSILQAIQLISELLVFSFGGKEHPDFGTIYWEQNPMGSISRISGSDPEAIWLQKRTSQQCKLQMALSGGVSIDLEIMGPNRYVFDITVKGKSIKSSITTMESRKIVEDIFAMRPRYLPPVGANSGTEEFMPFPQWINRLNQGLDVERWRLPMYWLWNDGNREAFNNVVRRVKKHFAATDVKPPRLAHGAPPNVLIEFEEAGTVYDISSAGAGLRSLLNLSSMLELSSSVCLLCDEPDAHLHGSLQAAVARMLLDYNYERECQIITASHAPDFLAEIPVDAMLWIDRRQTNAQPCSTLGRFLIDLGSVSKGDAIRSVGADKILFIEGHLDQEALERLFALTSMQSPFTDTKVVIAKLPSGQGDAAHLDGFARLLSETFKIQVSIGCIVDNDYDLPNSDVPSGRSRPLVLRLSRKEIENYLCDAETVFAAMKKAIEKRSNSAAQRKELPNEDEVRAKIALITQDQEILNPARYQIVPKYARELPAALDQSPRYKEAEEWFNSQCADPLWRLRVCSGKEILRRIRQWCQTEYGVTLTNTALIEALAKCPPDMAEIATKINAHFYAGS